jgi:hypothetical protein
MMIMVMMMDPSVSFFGSHVPGLALVLGWRCRGWFLVLR